MAVPKLRFPEFKEEWSENKLGEIADIKDSARISNTLWAEKGIPYLRSSDLVNKALQGELFISKETYDKYFPKTGAPQKDDLLFTSGGKVGVTYHKENNSEVYVQGGAVLYVKTSTSESLDGSFLKIYFSIEKIKKYMENASVGGTIKHFTLVPANAMPIIYPSIKEQQRVGLFFKNIDKKIQLQQEKIDLLKEQKKGFMQKIFSQELRFKDEDGEVYPNWKHEYLGNLCDINTGNKDTQNKIDNGQYPFFVRSQIVEKINSYSYDGEAILTAGDGVGVGKVFHYINGKFDFHQRVYMLSGFKNCVGKFIYYYFSNNFMREAQKYNAKTSVDSVRREMLTKMIFPFPSLAEQKKISDFLSYLDNKINLEEQNSTILQRQKQAFMQQMFI